MGIEWSPQQKQALELVEAWHKSANDPVFRLFGFAGTGKTTLARHFSNSVSGDTEYGAYTGKAAIVMRKSGCRGASTIHSMIYNHEVHPTTGAITSTLDKHGPASQAALIVIDECSMVGQEIGEDLLSFGTPILVLGDQEQLPPVTPKNTLRGEKSEFFTGQDPDYLLTEIHRQAEDSPIIKLATDVREGRGLQYGQYGESLVRPRRGLKYGDPALGGADQVLVGTRKTKAQFDRILRKLGDFEGDLPQPGDRLCCTKNDRTAGISNGSLFTVWKIPKKQRRANMLNMFLTSEDFPNREAIEVNVRKECFTGGIYDIPWQDLRGTQQFEFGNALTVHKSQGSQWDNVTLFDESRVFGEDARRWLYTGITRAAKQITILQ